MFQDTIKNFSISFDERNTFSAGDFITGTISFDLTKEIKISALTIKIKGGANVQWSTASRSGNLRRRNYRARMEFFTYKSAIIQTNTAVNGTTKLAAGTHVYPFSCQLPEGNFPSSFRGIHGRISYSLTVSIDRPWHLSKDFRTELNFVSYIDPHQPELWAPLSGSNFKTLCCLWCTSGPITMTVSLERKAFKPGETVKVMCSFSNASSRTVTPNVKLEQKQIYYTHYRTNWTKVVKTLARFTGNPISAHTSDVQTEILLPIPLNAPQTISNCMILEVEYIIEVSLCLWGSPDLIVVFPIVLCELPAYWYLTE
ncbi:arrestin domain-containing protein 3-like [Xiphophorus couchianus]|uniref:arrestin domain-containing protein 3-like n=1 Tax=Xiphophorus couchianus TaxID=32473 RepID=UPI001015F600|nr:arrestin domain-containing protein 3-like [Xiphophorus couchianus]